MSIRLLEPPQAELDEAIGWYAEQAPGLKKRGPGSIYYVAVSKSGHPQVQASVDRHMLMPCACNT